MEVKAREIRDRIFPDHLAWFANYLVIRRVVQVCYSANYVVPCLCFRLGLSSSCLYVMVDSASQDGVHSLIMTRCQVHNFWVTHCCTHHMVFHRGYLFIAHTACSLPCCACTRARFNPCRGRSRRCRTCWRTLAHATCTRRPAQPRLNTPCTCKGGACSFPLRAITRNACLLDKALLTSAPARPAVGCQLSVVLCA